MLGHRILIADDELDIRNVLRRLLLSDGFCVCEAGDGIEALAAVDRCEVSVIVMDMLMPGMNGSEAIRLLRTNPRFATTPILIITGHSALRPQQWADPRSSIQVLTKPLNLDQMLATVNQLVQAAEVVPVA
jgi:CheY-like chemotaxis protein